MRLAQTESGRSLFPCSEPEGPCFDVPQSTVTVEEATQGQASECNKGPTSPHVCQ